MTNELRILRYLYAGLRLTGKEVVAPNGNVVQRVRYQTLMNLLAHGWITRDTSGGRYTLTTEGRARALVKVRVDDFLASLADQSALTQP